MVIFHRRSITSIASSCRTKFSQMTKLRRALRWWSDSQMSIYRSNYSKEKCWQWIGPNDRVIIRSLKRVVHLVTYPSLRLRIGGARIRHSQIRLRPRRDSMNEIDYWLPTYHLMAKAQPSSYGAIYIFPFWKAVRVDLSFDMSETYKEYITHETGG